MTGIKNYLELEGDECEQWIYCDRCASEMEIESFRKSRARVRFAIDRFAYYPSVQELRITCAHPGCETVLRMTRTMKPEMVND